MGQAWFSSAPLTVAEFIAPAYTIALEKDHYLPGDTLQGYVSLEVHEPTPFCAIEVRVLGRGFVRAPARAAPAAEAAASEAELAGGGPVTREMSYLDRSVRLDGDEEAVLAVGRHQFDFSVDLPSKNLPASCGEETPGVSFQVAYHVEAFAESAAKELQLVRSVYLNMETAPAADPDTVSGTVVSKTLNVRSYDGVNAAVALFTGGISLLGVGGSVQRNCGKWSFDDFKLDSRLIAPGRAIAVAGKVRNRCDETMLLSLRVQPKIIVAHPAEGTGGVRLDLDKRPNTALLMRKFQGELLERVPFREKREVVTSVALTRWPPLPTMSVPGLVEVSYELVLAASKMDQSYWSHLTSSVPELRVPVVVQRDGHAPDWDWALGQKGMRYEERVALARKRQVAEEKAKASVWDWFAAKKPPPPPPRTPYPFERLRPSLYEPGAHSRHQARPPVTVLPFCANIRDPTPPP